MSSAWEVHVKKDVAGAAISRVTFKEAAGLLVQPDDHNTEGKSPGILWLHWLGHNRGNMRQFLPEAVDLASEGAVSLLPQGTFPWSSSPTGTPTDCDMVRSQLKVVEGALSALRRWPTVDPNNIAIVGHDYGAMYGLLLRDPDVQLLIAATPDADWHSWFLTYWPHRVADLDDYRQSLAALTPVSAAASYGRRLFLQWGTRDEYVAQNVPGLYESAAPHARVASYDYDHQLGDAAIGDRLDALRACLFQSAPAVKRSYEPT